MAAREALISDWQERLRTSEAQLATAAPRLAWLFRARARIYRLLLAMYGGGNWRAYSIREEKVEHYTEHAEAVFQREPADECAAEMLVVVTLSGKPPKTIAEIR